MRKMKSVYESYIQNTTAIRLLSTPHVNEIHNAEEFGVLLRDNFSRIRELSRETVQFIDQTLFPLVKNPDTAEKEDLLGLSQFLEILMDAYDLETLDATMGWYVSDQISDYMLHTGTFKDYIRLLDLRLSAYYTMCLKTRRIEAVSDLSEKYRQKGLQIAEYFEQFLNPEKLREIPDEETRERVIMNARYGHCMYEGMQADFETRQKDLLGLERILTLPEDSEITALVPNFDWDYNTFRTLEYLGLAVEYGNMHGYTVEEREHLYPYAVRLYEMWHSNPEHYGKMSPGGRIDLALLLNTYQSGRVTKTEYKEKLIDFFLHQNPEKNYDSNSIYAVFHTPLAYLCVMEGEEPTQRDIEALTMFYHGIMECALHSDNSSVESFILELVYMVLERFIEVPEVSFEQMILTCMAALHTPTYIHSLMVGTLTKYLTDRMILRQPELFVGLRGTANAGEVLERRSELVNFAYHAALLHDTGKLAIIETIYIYERKLLPFEFLDIIRMHPPIGEYLLSRNPSTREYGPIALGHHKWYDNTQGYPETYDTSKSSQKILIDIVACADCMDAATDSIGRSYNIGKTFDDFLGELSEGSGTRYSPDLAELLKDEEIIRDIRNILEHERERNYQNTYWLLKT
ncbi:MAG: HD domain-containing protein [Blautia sp.]|nr:HD domain-containing protein [Blautia sp.]